MFVSMIKYSRKCSSFYFLIMSQDNTYKLCLLDVRDQGQKNNAVLESFSFKLRLLHDTGMIHS